jgi:hypothetical protein
LPSGMSLPAGRFALGAEREIAAPLKKGPCFPSNPRSPLSTFSSGR